MAEQKEDNGLDEFHHPWQWRRTEGNTILPARMKQHPGPTPIKLTKHEGCSNAQTSSQTIEAQAKHLHKTPAH
eukprot:1200538-Pyramimonas_sp.AAC.1